MPASKGEKFISNEKVGRWISRQRRSFGEMCLHSYYVVPSLFLSAHFPSFRRSLFYLLFYPRVPSIFLFRFVFSLLFTRLRIILRTRYNFITVFHIYICFTITVYSNCNVLASRWKILFTRFLTTVLPPAVTRMCAWSTEIRCTTVLESF